MDQAKRSYLIERMGVVSKYNGGIAAEVIHFVTPEEYFDGAEGEAPFLCNSIEELDNDSILERLIEIRNRPDVHDVRVALINCDDDEWPFSDKIIIVTRCSEEEVLDWLPAGFQPDEIYDAAGSNLDAEKVDVPSGYRLIWLWFD